MRISCINAGYTLFRGSVKSTGYLLHSTVSPSLPLPASPCVITFQLESTEYRLTGYPLHSPVPLHFPSRASPCSITFQLESTEYRLTGYSRHSPISASLPLPCVTVFHHISTGVYRVPSDGTFVHSRQPVLPPTL